MVSQELLDKSFGFDARVSGDYCCLAQRGCGESIAVNPGPGVGVEGAGRVEEPLIK